MQGKCSVSKLAARKAALLRRLRAHIRHLEELAEDMEARLRPAANCRRSSRACGE